MFDFIKKFFQPKADITKLVKDGAVIVDVRTKPEYQAAHIEGSLNIPLDNIRREVIALRKLNRPVVTVCRSGNRSAMARSILASAGIQVYNGGAWSNLKKQLQ